MKVTKFFRGFLMCCVVGLAACGGGSHPTPVLGPDGQPTGQMVQQQDSPGLLGMFGASLAGNMVGNWLSRPSAAPAAPAYGGAPQTTVNKTVVNRTVIVNNHPASPSPTTSPVRPPVVTTSPVVKPPAPSISKAPVVSGTRTWASTARSTSSFSSSRGGRR